MEREREWECEREKRMLNKNYLMIMKFDMLVSTIDFKLAMCKHFFLILKIFWSCQDFKIENYQDLENMGSRCLFSVEKWWKNDFQDYYRWISTSIKTNQIVSI